MSRARVGVLGRELPAPAPELDPREAPERAGAARLVALAPLLVLALEQERGRRRSLRHDDEHRRDRDVRLLQQLRVAGCGRELVRPGRVRRSLGVAGRNSR